MPGRVHRTVVRPTASSNPGLSDSSLSRNSLIPRYSYFPEPVRESGAHIALPVLRLVSNNGVSAAIWSTLAKPCSSAASMRCLEVGPVKPGGAHRCVPPMSRTRTTGRSVCATLRRDRIGTGNLESRFRASSALSPINTSASFESHVSTYSPGSIRHQSRKSIRTSLHGRGGLGRQTYPAAGDVLHRAAGEQQDARGRACGGDSDASQRAKHVTQAEHLRYGQRASLQDPAFDCAWAIARGGMSVNSHGPAGRYR